MTLSRSKKDWYALSPEECRCSILNAREEKLLDDEGRVLVRLICNLCGRILDSEVIDISSFHPRPKAREAE